MKEDWKKVVSRPSYYGFDQARRAAPPVHGGAGRRRPGTSASGQCAGALLATRLKCAILHAGKERMKLREVLSIIDGKVISSNIDLDEEVQMGCGSDLMSDVLAFTHEDALLMTGLTNPQVVRTTEMVGIKVIVFVRGKLPPPETIALAKEKDIALLASKYTMFETCGRLYKAGLPGCGLFELSLRRWRQAFENKQRAPGG